MSLSKQPVAINFSKGLDLKSDPYQVPVGSFLALNNSIFDKSGRLTKRNGYANINTLPNTSQTILTTLNDNLTAIGSDLYAYSAATSQWLNQGLVQPVSLSVLPLVRVSTSQTAPDAQVTASGLTCLVYMDSGNSYYQVSDSTTGQQIVPRKQLPATAVSPRVFQLGSSFIVTFLYDLVSAPNLAYVAVPIASPDTPGAVTQLSGNVGSLSSGYDACVFSDVLYYAWEGSSNTVRIAYMTQSLSVSNGTILTGVNASTMSVSADVSNSYIWIAFNHNTAGYSAAFATNLTQVMATTPINTTDTINTISSIIQDSVLQVFYEAVTTYPYGTNPRTDVIKSLSVTLPVSGTGVGTATTASVVERSVGLASKPILDASGSIYMLVVYGCTSNVTSSDNSNQSSYFLIDSSGNILMRMAYSNAGGYASNQVLPNISLSNGNYQVPYLANDFLATVNKGTGLPTGTPTSAIYTQTGVNLAQFSINQSSQYSAEIAGALHLTGGQLWEYDGVRPVEHGFQVWPENIQFTDSSASGGLTKQIYYYYFTYEWTDNQGNLHRSAPSIPLKVDLSASSTATNTVTIFVPTLRLTYKLAPNPVRIVGYRWSQAQQVAYQFTSITAPVVNDPTVDYVTIVDAAADLAILGQTLLYTTGGVVEDIAAPASIASALFSNRLFLIDAEDRNLLWFSKQVIEATPVEMSDLLTIYVAPTSGAQGSTGPMTALAAMDDKLIIFKKDAIYYINGTGPDNTGANSTFSDPIFITSSVGCSNPNSIVLMPNGIMFQSDKGIWLLGRDLSSNYIGAPVEQYNSSTITSAINIPGTNQIRFILDSNITLVYDYFFGQWATHSNIFAISATLYNGLHTYLNSYGQILQEKSGSYVDVSTPVLMSLTTSWLNVAGLQGYERFYFANLLGTYFSPFKLDVQLSYDYASSSPSQSIIVTPDNYTAPWGGEAQWGSGGPWGGVGNVFSARLFPQQQKCESFQLTINELYDASLGVSPGQGLTLSGLALIVGLKKGYRTQSAKKSFG